MFLTVQDTPRSTLKFLHHSLVCIFPSFYSVCFVCLYVARQPPVGQGLLIHEVSRSHTTTHHSRQDSSVRVISSSQRPLPVITQHSKQTNIHALAGIRTHNLSRRATADLRLRPRGHCKISLPTYVGKEILHDFLFRSPCLSQISCDFF